MLLFVCCVLQSIGKCNNATCNNTEQPLRARHETIS